MGEFVKPERLSVYDKNYIERLVQTSLVKDLHDGEEICAHCHGTGLVVANNPYGLTDDPDRAHLFPYMHQSLSFCPRCYNGVVRRCKLCGEIMPKGLLKHNCEKQRQLDREEAEKRETEALINAPEATQDIIKNCGMFYSDWLGVNEGYFEDWDEFFDYWESEHEPEDERPEWAWTTYAQKMHIDASDILESATEDMYEDAIYDISDQKVKELQSYLDGFCETCGVSCTYYKDQYKVRIPWEEYDESQA